MQFVKYFLITALLLTAMFLGIGWYIQPVSGDLTRLGGISERSWGWNQTQPVVEVQPNKTDSKGPIVVIGDSFSEKNVWQSILTKDTGWSIYTYHWLDLEPSTCLENALEDIKRKFPETRFIILQSLERLIIDRFGNGFASSKICKKSIGTSIEPKHIGATQATRNLTSDLMPDPVYAIKALYHELFKYNELTLSGDTYITPLMRSDLFSNAKSSHLTFYKRDLEKADWTQEKLNFSASNIKKLSDRLAKDGIVLAVMPVPDKSTIYAEFLQKQLFDKPIPNVWDAFADANIKTVNVRGAFANSIKKIKDLYLPDDTHVGQIGYQLIAYEVESFIVNTLGSSK